MNNEPKIRSSTKYKVEDDVRRATGWQELEARAEQAERELEALIGASTGRLHDCDDACTWAHSEYAKLLMKGQREAERERDEARAVIGRAAIWFRAEAREIQERPGFDATTGAVVAGLEHCAAALEGVKR